MDVADRVLELLYDRRESYLQTEELASAAGLRPGRVEEILATLRARGRDIEFVDV